MRLIEGASAALRELSACGYATVLISNQAGYAKGKATLRALWLTHEKFIRLLTADGAKLDGIFYSYGHPKGVVRYFSGPSLERKPCPYHLFVAAAQLDLDLARCWMVGDRWTDVECAIAAGVKPILVCPDARTERVSSDVQRVSCLSEAVSKILESRSVASCHSSGQTVI